jgi:hypothetical protein
MEKDNYKVSINISKLRTEVQSRENRKYKTFEKVLETCYQKILSTNKTSDECCCTFICPQVIFGLPLYNLMECINFIMEKLVEKGFETHLALPNHIYISWKPDSEKRANELKHYYLQLGAPIQQMQLEYNTNNTNNTNNSRTSNMLASTSNDKKLFMNKSKDKQKQYRPIEDYHSNMINNTYDNDDIDIFQSKIDELFN